MPREKTVKIKCATCGKEYLTTSYQILNNNRNFCCRKCHHIGISKGNSVRWKGGLETKKCLQCGNFFTVRRDVINRGYGKFCNHLCMGKFYQTQRSGSGGTNWKGGVTKEIARIKNSIKYRKWAQKVSKRDKFICQKCGKIGGILHQHHIKRFSIILKEAVINLPLLNMYDAAMCYDPLWDIKNGQTLCFECHMREHQKR